MYKDTNNNYRIPRLSPIIKWEGGKEKELTEILPRIPDDFENYYEPFVGGGAVYFAIDKPKMFINDKSSELINLYLLIQKQDTVFFERLEAINQHWRLIERIVENHNSELLKIYKDYSLGISSKQSTDDTITEFVVHHAEEFNGILETSLISILKIFSGRFAAT